ncbi:MAG TPA: Asp-tRNA(Asn)/Glu-tRNA(Gln) amidotransferase subunit GatC [Acidimicrobiales bacterium]|nr:Asp-tRNA(Asn)/Glu-tRNA(Gln) amidotransferase subunit GatC [Acidimicrobiales bacterium]
MAVEFTPEEVTYVAALARLELTEAEVEHYARQLSAVLGHVDAIRALDLTGVEPSSHSFDLVNVLREDVVAPSLDRDEVLRAAPLVESGRFRVPPILGEAP